jgi:hypothetical protein
MSNEDLFICVVPHENLWTELSGSGRSLKFKNQSMIDV